MLWLVWLGLVWLGLAVLVLVRRVLVVLAVWFVRSAQTTVLQRQSTFHDDARCSFLA